MIVTKNVLNSDGTFAVTNEQLVLLTQNYQNFVEILTSGMAEAEVLFPEQSDKFRQLRDFAETLFEE